MEKSVKKSEPEQKVKCMYGQGFWTFERVLMRLKTTLFMFNEERIGQKRLSTSKSKVLTYFKS